MVVMSSTMNAPGGKPDAGGKTASYEDQREHVRVDLEAAVDFESESNFYTGLTQNISTGGLFLATNKLLPIGASLRLKFTIPGRRDAIETEAEVRWVKQMSSLERVEGSQGMGLRFVSLAPEVADAIDAFTKRRESLYYDDEG